MPDFDRLFEEANFEPVIYKGSKLVRCDKFPVENGDILVASIENTKSDRKQVFL
jgi:hypothetical protein